MTREMSPTEGKWVSRRLILEGDVYHGVADIPVWHGICGKSTLVKSCSVLDDMDDLPGTS
jgi:hypothetical protein